MTLTDSGPPSRAKRSAPVPLPGVRSFPHARLRFSVRRLRGDADAARRSTGESDGNLASDSVEVTMASVLAVRGHEALSSRLRRAVTGAGSPHRLLAEVGGLDEAAG